MTCPVCGSIRHRPMLYVGNQPASLLEMTKDPEESAFLTRHEIYMRICSHCCHVFNGSYRESATDYDGDGCRMYNKGELWQEHIAEVRRICESVEVDTIIEIGAGDCSFLNSINSKANKVAIDPCRDVLKGYKLGISCVRDSFRPFRHLTSGDGSTLIIMRHLLEHTTNPREFLEDIVNVLRERNKPCYLFIETPNCGNALKNCRVEDWTYEHPQHFNLVSMAKLFTVCGLHSYAVKAGYGGEVVVAYGSIPLVKREKIKPIIEKYSLVSANVRKVSDWIKDNLSETALWGGAGKSALFINMFGIPDEARVVDIDDSKWGFCVPGTRIPILSPLTLKKFPVKNIIVTTSWRADDIKRQIQAEGIEFERLLKFENGELVEVELEK